MRNFQAKNIDLLGHTCDLESCEVMTVSQVYRLTQERPDYTREWTFHSMVCLRKWATQKHSLAIAG